MFGRKLLMRGFTLVEVMIVIVIMLMLASMLLVGFTRAHRTAEMSHCMNNLRQIGTCIITYTSQQGGGYLPNFGIRDQRVREQWVWALDFITRDDRYLSRQSIDKLLPPRFAPRVLRCPADVRLFVNSQSALTSYWMHPENSYKVLAWITDQDETMLSMEGDALYVVANCGCRFHSARPPEEVDYTHFGGGHILFVDGTVRLITDPVERKRRTWEAKAGWGLTYLKEKWPAFEF